MTLTEPRTARARGRSTRKDARFAGRGSVAIVAGVAVSGALGLGLGLGLGACRPRAVMCGAPIACAGTAACVAGRCQPLDGGPEIMPTYTDGGVIPTYRVVAEPTEIALLRRGEGPRKGMLPALFTLGRQGDGGAVLLLRFALVLPPKTSVVEAYLLLQPTSDLDADPTPIALHLAQIRDPWDERSVSWGRPPRWDGAREPTTFVRPRASGIVRLDARALVAHWRLHDPEDQGLAVVAEATSLTGMAFAMSGSLPSPTPSIALPSENLAPHVAAGPRLEVYLK